MGTKKSSQKNQPDLISNGKINQNNIIESDPHQWAPQIRAIELEIVKFYTETIPKFNQRNPILSAITAYFLVRRKLTQSELQQLSGYSAGMVSECIRDLLEMKMITKETLPKSHTHQYIMKEVPYTSINLLLSMETQFDQVYQDLKSLQLKAESLSEFTKKTPKYSHINSILSQLITVVSLFPELKKIYQEEISKIIPQK
jgi:DNA-binding transcriptional regulator GbsR (MarR family)